MLFVGDDWAEDHHNVEIVDDDGLLLTWKRLPDGVVGFSELQSLIADHLTEETNLADVIIGIEADRGPWVHALVRAGYTVYVINPLQEAGHPERQSILGATSDPGGAHGLAELVRLDRAHHRSVTGNTDTAEHIKMLAQGYENRIWSRHWHTDILRSMLWDFYPAALLAFGDLIDRDDGAAPPPAPLDN